MFTSIRQAWKAGNLKSKLLFTILIMVVFRIGSIIPVPFLDTVALKFFMSSMTGVGALMSYFDTLSGGAFAQATLFAMSIQPYINSQIIMQLLTVALPSLEAMQREGEEGHKRIMAITRCVTIGLGIMQGLGYYSLLRGRGMYGIPIIRYTDGLEGIFVMIVIICVFTAGTALMMWMGEQINEKGIGNGVSIMMFAGIVSRMPGLLAKLGSYIYLAITQFEQNWKFLLFVPVFILIFLGMMWLIVFMNDAERRIPIQYAKRVVGARMLGSDASHLPFKIGLAGVMPVVFASSILGVPSLISLFVAPTGFFKAFLDALSIDSWIYTVVFFVLILAFAYFYVSISYNPLEIANNLRQSGAAIPGIRPGKPTMLYLSKVLNSVTLTGALFLAFIAVFPVFFTRFPELRGLSISGTSIIILVGTALETVKILESQSMMKRHKGFLDV